MKTRMFRRMLVVVSFTSAVTIVLVAIAMAIKVPVGSQLTGQSKHQHYRITLIPECFTSGCTRATTIGVQVTTGNPRHPSAACVSGTFQLANASLHRARFATAGQVLMGTRTVTLKVAGVFTSSRRARGTVTGPRICGGSDTFRVSEALSVG